MTGALTPPVTVAVAIDAAYLPWVATLIRSILDADPDDVYDLHVLSDGSLGADDRHRLASLVAAPSALTFHDVDPSRLAGLPTGGGFGPVVWLRLHIPDLLAQTARALYLDADTYVSAPLRPLFESDLGGRPIGAVANVVEPEYRPHVRQLGIAYPGGLFNSGVLVLDLERLRAEHALEALVEATRTRAGPVRWPDQEALNIVFADRWAPLHPRWNAQNSLWLWPEWAIEVFGPEPVRQAIDHPAVRHFEGPSVSKPWHYLCPYPGQRAYLATLARTPWAGTGPLDRTAATRLIKVLPARWRLGTYRRLLAWRLRGGR